MTEQDVLELAQIRERLRVWQQEHPRATLTEIEAEVDRQLHAVRARMLAAVAVDAATELGDCPDCGGRLVRRGTRERTLSTIGAEALVLQRPYATCSRCGRGLFPPG